MERENAKTRGEQKIGGNGKLGEKMRGSNNKKRRSWRHVQSGLMANNKAIHCRSDEREKVRKRGGERDGEGRKDNGRDERGEEECQTKGAERGRRGDEEERCFAKMSLLL